MGDRPRRGDYRMHWNSAGGEKRRYSTREEAREAARSLLREVGTRPELATYLCPWCDGWHFGNKRRRPPRGTVFVDDIHLLGERVAYALKVENTGRPGERMKAIRKVGRAAERRARHKRDGQPVHTGAHKKRAA